MKRFGFAVLLLVGFVARGFCNILSYEIPGNPDRYPSVAFGYLGGKLNAAPSSIDTKSLDASLRFPLSAQATFELLYSNQTQSPHYQNLNLNQNFQGNLYGANIRIYFVPEK